MPGGAHIFSVIRQRRRAWCTIRTSRSTPAWRASSKRGGERSGRAGHQAGAVPHVGRQPVHPRPGAGGGARASRSRCWSSCGRGSTRRGTSTGPGSWRRPGCTSRTAWSASRRTRRSRWWCAGRANVRALLRAHVGTGQLPQPSTAKLYEDIGLLTCDPEMLTHRRGRTCSTTSPAGPPKQNYQKLLVAPHNDEERQFPGADPTGRSSIRARAARGRIIAKMNQLQDTKVIIAAVRGERGRRVDRPDRAGLLHAAAGGCGA
jgi:hypothetical protein